MLRDPSDPRRSTDPRSSRRDAAARTFCFSVQAAAEPGVMPRVLELFARRNLVPARWVSHVETPAQTPHQAPHHAPHHAPHQALGELTIDFQVAGLDPDLTAYLARCLSQIADVRAVLTSEKADAAIGL